ncbi:hypothetical protein [Leptospira mayottensis]|nr:hypothetical protein [Leptospira mayottensis]
MLAILQMNIDKILEMIHQDRIISKIHKLIGNQERVYDITLAAI